jgi:amino-acid N-acetyltransferase
MTLAEGASAPVYRPASASVRPAVVDLLRACDLPHDDVSADLQHFFVATIGEEVIGTVGLDALGDVALFRSLAVAPAWRGTGVAHQLWGRARHRAVDLGVRELFLLTTTAERLFARWGFERIARADAPPIVRATSEYRSLCPASAALMHLAL